MVTQWFRSLRQRSKLAISHTTVGGNLYQVLVEGAHSLPFSGGNLTDRAASRAYSLLAGEVERIWVQGVLEASTRDFGIMKLRLQLQANAVEHSWRGLIDKKQQPVEDLAGLTISQIYQSVGRRLLILGEPGTGKSTLLLQLAKDLLSASSEDIDNWAPLPLVLHLSSWGRDDKNFSLWIAKEMNERYGVALKLAELWIENELIIPLLDGLDEIMPERRTGCMNAINSFLADHGQLPFCICSRTADYQKASSKFRLNSAIKILPLDYQQVSNYLSAQGERLAGLQAAVAEDPKFKKLLNTPLMTNIAASVYAGERRENIQSAGSSSKRREDLIATYLAQMLTRPTGLKRSKTHRRFSNHDETVHWLSWLASSMKEHGQRIFYIDWIQSAWLPDERDQIFVATAASRFARNRLFIVLLAAWYVALGYWSQLPHFQSVLPFMWISGPIVVAVTVLAVTRPLNTGGMYVRPTEGLAWSWHPVRSNLRKVIWRAFRDSFLAMSFTMAIAAMHGWHRGVLAFFCVGTQIILLGGAVRALDFGLEEKLAIKPLAPGSGIRSSDRTAFTFGLACGVIAGEVTFVMAYFATQNLQLAFTNAAFGYYVTFTLGGLLHGGSASVRHRKLLSLLARRKLAPSDYVAFLDYAASRVILRKVGGGYMFIHSYVMMYLASAWEDPDHLLDEIGKAALD